MSSSLQPITLYAHGGSPNPLKVAIILEELSVPYKIVNLSSAELKQEPYTTINPNGRVPAIEDPNTGISLWESGAIIQYLVERYDGDGRISTTTVPEKYQLNQWLQFQVSGQGPYFGQAWWFLYFHPEPLPSAQERYINEVERVTAVLDSWLQSHPFLVGQKLTYADLSFVPYANAVLHTSAVSRNGKLFEAGKYAAYSRWLHVLLARPSVKKILAQFPPTER
ncbi:glutathione S-transferase [Capronia epimyces CBS 606.96]|uniref:Glutathione S-transferase n=1 Tax=Capronia epimyces CBS 606.96 TaxID=1182542 RepID=W9Y9L2_9EURO|nr:glutathione S-transferase [Capronia epimyces CBS 606.96]EXJ89223.1 glutathione S-transferase [Capronia epimyces CBS 606.96]